MPWIKLDDQIGHHPKLHKAGAIAAWMWVCGTGYCNKYLTDGFIPDDQIRSLGNIPNPPKHAEVLVSTGLWERVEGGYRVHDFHDHNPTAAQVRHQRKVKSDAGKAGAEARWQK